MPLDETHPIFRDLQLLFMSIQPKNLLIISNENSPYPQLCKTALKNIPVTCTTFSSVSIYLSTLSTPSNLEQLNEYTMALITAPLNNLDSTQLTMLLQLLFSRNIQYICLVENIDPNHSVHEKIFSIDLVQFQYYFKEYLDTPIMIKLHLFKHPTYYPPVPQDDMHILDICDKKLNLAYWLSHNKLKGGLKSLLLQIEHLAKRGHHITVYRQGQSGEPVLPSWWNESIPNLDTKLITENLPIDLCLEKHTDLLIICTARTTFKIANFSIPTILWEEGYPTLFGEMPNIGRNYLKLTDELTAMYRSPIYIFSVSFIVQQILKTKYGRNTFILPNGIDTTAYTPNHSKTFNSTDKITILLVGKPSDRTKRFDRALRVLDKVYINYKNIRVKWISQEQPENLHREYIEWVIMPNQVKLQEYYRNADILLSTSIYEGFGMPPLEAMASGTSVVAVNSGGILDYAIDKKNILLCNQGDEDALYASLVALISSPSLRQKLSINGRKTALEYDYANTSKLVEQYFYNVYIHWNSNTPIH